MLILYFVFLVRFCIFPVKSVSRRSKLTRLTSCSVSHILFVLHINFSYCNPGLPFEPLTIRNQSRAQINSERRLGKLPFQSNGYFKCSLQTCWPLCARVSCCGPTQYALKTIAAGEKRKTYLASDFEPASACESKGWMVF
jgi:hypothetical protein